MAINHRIDVKSYTSLHTLVHDMFPPTSMIEQVMLYQEAELLYNFSRNRVMFCRATVCKSCSSVTWCPHRRIITRGTTGKCPCLMSITCRKLGSARVSVARDAGQIFGNQYSSIHHHFFFLT